MTLTDCNTASAGSSQPARKIQSGECPIGWWRCTHSTFPEFEAGKEYPCVQAHSSYDINGKLMPVSGRCFRIYPTQTRKPTTWAPFWSDGSASFCYPKKDLDFEFVRRMTLAEEALFLGSGFDPHAFDSLRQDQGGPASRPSRREAQPKTAKSLINFRVSETARAFLLGGATGSILTAIAFLG